MRSNFALVVIGLGAAVAALGVAVCGADNPEFKGGDCDTAAECTDCLAQIVKVKGGYTCRVIQGSKDFDEFQYCKQSSDSGDECDNNDVGNAVTDCGADNATVKWWDCGMAVDGTCDISGCACVAGKNKGTLGFKPDEVTCTS